MTAPFRDLPEPAKYAIDAASAGVTLAALLQWLPALAAFLTIVWTAIRIWETETVQALFGRPRSGSRDDE